MSLATFHVKFVNTSYSFVRRSRVLETELGQRLFTSSYFLYKRFLEDSSAGLVHRYPELIRGGHVLDVGANIGYTACVFARGLDAGFLVYAFEPEQFNFTLLEKALERFKVGSRVIAVQAAVGTSDGSVTLAKNALNPADHRVLTDAFRDSAAACATVEVPLRSIDSFVHSEGVQAPIALIKIDVQGYELAVCGGMERTLETNPGCAVMMEFMPEALTALGFDPDELLCWFEKRGFLAHTIHGNGHLSPSSPRNLGSNRYVDLLFSRRKIA